MTNDAARAKRIARIIEEVTSRSVAEEEICEETILAAHPDLMPELGEELRELRQVLEARQRAADPHETRVSGQRDAPERGAGAELLASISRSLPAYDIQRELHRGQQGVVYLAVQKSTRREVAIKIMREGPFAGTRDRSRFEREVQVLGRLQHPNIVTIHDSGSAAGCAYFVMDYISGKSLGEHVAEAKLGIEDKLRLFVTICDAVYVAHLRGIIHRDLKPSNIRVDSNGEPQVLDFGLAKVAGAEDEAAVHMTRTGEFVGTPAYAAPEQMRFDSDAVDLRTDLYALGMILFEMLTGRFPYEISSNVAELVDTIVNAPPQPPSRFAAQVDGELDTILLKALEKDPDQRYPSVDAFAADIRRYLAGEPILAHPPSVAYQFRKLVQRHRLAFAFGVTVLVLLVAFGVVSSIMAARLAEERNTAISAQQEERVQRRLADRKTIEAEEMRAMAEEKRLAAEDSEEEARRQLAEAQWQAYVAGLAAADTALRAGDPAAAVRRIDRVPRELINWEWWYLSRQTDTATGSSDAPHVRVLDEHKGVVGSLAFDPDGTRLVTAADDGSLTLWKAATGERIAALAGHAGRVRAVAYNPESRLIASGASDQTVRLWEGRTGKPVATLLTDAGVACLAWTPDGSTLAAGCEDGSIWLWDAASRERLATLESPTGGVSAITFAPHEQLLASAGSDGTARLWDVATGEAVATIRSHMQAIRALAFNSSGSLLACGSQDGSITLWDVKRRQTVADLHGHMKSVNALAFSPDGSRLVSGSEDATLRLWDPRMNDETLTLYGHAGPVRAVAFSPDGARIASASADGTVRLWQAQLSAEELVANYFDDLVLAGEVVAFLEADDAMEPHLRSVALRIARSRGDDSDAIDAAARAILDAAVKEMRDCKRALHFAQVASNLAPDRAGFRLTLGRALACLGRFAEAESSLQEAWQEQSSSETAGSEERQATLRGLIELHEFWKKPLEAERYRALLRAEAAGSQSSGP